MSSKFKLEAVESAKIKLDAETESVSRKSSNSGISVVVSMEVVVVVVVDDVAVLDNDDVVVPDASEIVEVGSITDISGVVSIEEELLMVANVVDDVLEAVVEGVIKLSVDERVVKIVSISGDVKVTVLVVVVVVLVVVVGVAVVIGTEVGVIVVSGVYFLTEGITAITDDGSENPEIAFGRRLKLLTGILWVVVVVVEDVVGAI